MPMGVLATGPILYGYEQLNTRPMDRSQSGGTGPSAYGTGPTVINNLGPVPRYIFMKNFEDCALNIGF